MKTTKIMLVLTIAFLLIGCSPKTYRIARDTNLYGASGGKLFQLALLRSGTIVEPASPDKLLCKDFVEEGITLSLCDIRLDIDGIPPRGWILENAIR